MNWDWEPGVGCGPFVLGAPLPQASETLSIVDLGWGDDGTGWESFNVQDGAASVHVAAGVLVAMDCWRQLFHKGQNLVGMARADLERLFAGQLAQAARVGDAQSLGVEGQGLTLWIEEGHVESASIERV